MKSHHRLLCLSAALALAGPPVIHAQAAAPDARPNILLITADDLGCLLSSYGEKRITTPKLDALAASGVLFRNAYVAEPSCSQSRASLLTGLWPHQNGQVGLAGFAGFAGFRMHPNQTTLPGLLKSAGYRTGIIGKLHVDPAKDFPFDWMPPRVGMAVTPTRRVRWVAEQSRDFFASAKAAGQPFFHYVNYFDPHVPLTKATNQVEGLPETPLTAADIKDPLPLGAPDEEKNRLATARMLNAISRVDTGIGLLLDELQAAGLADNTIVIFAGDNGTAMPRAKTWSYEAGVRVPMIVRWPGVAQPGQARDELVSLLDVMPTLLAATGVRPPDNLVGAALQPLLRGESPKDWREFLFTENNFHGPEMFRGQRSVRDARYKLMLNLVSSPHRPESGEMLDFELGGVNEGSLSAGILPPLELFDLQTDPNETKNLVDDPAHAGARRRLETALQLWREKEADPLLDPARLQRWKDASARWNELPRVKAGNAMIVIVPEGELDLLK
jgi:N-sulfoglucosamine sulfohydrolase